ncbi:hypothetical protein KZ483_16780 [Paenibacillus sp. sptzw28]|uniref:hypothetical protein n=1 Tax=Paenibacillus sp. sptzw28 TaxID=715179 RepID=UPI001C6F1109|nr:hypothetical protein [Paenibacillus sp. sptzw28]QYR19559.1 hypothetical protein KZ483_16780 [Paenibacillus sp. sptzw28]
MEAAFLHDGVVYIERERGNMLRLGLTPEAAREHLEAKYRIYSREKGAFTCACCGQRVVMVLYEDKAIFRHYDIESCTGEKNYAAYNAGRERAAELVRKHADGMELLREALSERHGEHYTAEEGYLHKKELRHVPDFLLTFDNGEKWALDYIVALRGDSLYRRRLRSRLSSYRANGFKPLFLLDRAWLAVTESAYISYNQSELEMRLPANPYDERWRHAISDLPMPLPGPVHSIVYLDVPKAQAVLTRFQLSGDRWGRLLFEPSELALPELLAADESLLTETGERMLKLFKPGEQSAISRYCGRLKQELLMAREEEAAVQKEAHKPGLKERQEIRRSVNPVSGAAIAAPAIPAADASKLLSLLERCKQSPRRPDYPGLENNLARAEVCVARVMGGADDAEDCYRAAWSLLRNMSYPLLGE